MTSKLLDIDAEVGELVSYEVVADPVVRQRFVRLDDEAAYLPAEVLEHDDPLDAAGPGSRRAVPVADGSAGMNASGAIRALRHGSRNVPSKASARVDQQRAEELDHGI
jgi:hypothetical protein